MSSAYVEKKLAEINEDAVYASLGAYDPGAFAAYVELRRMDLETIEARCNSEEDQAYRDRYVGRVESPKDTVEFPKETSELNPLSDDELRTYFVNQGYVTEEFAAAYIAGFRYATGWSDPMNDPNFVYSYEKDGMQR